MKFGFIKTAAAIPLVRVGDCNFNRQQTQALLQRAAKAGVEIIVFPELGLTGYTCADLFGQRVLLEQAEENLKKLIADTARLPLLAAVGMPIQINHTLYNCAVIFQQGKILGVVPKTFLPNYAEFQEKRWFHSGAEATVTSLILAGQEVPFGTDLVFACGPAIVGVEICEDLWAPIPPSSQLAISGANIILNLSASNELVGKHTYLKQLLLQQSARCCSGYIYASAGAGESTTDLLFAGNALIAENGLWLAQAKRFERKEQLVMADIDIEKLQAERAFHTVFSDEKPTAKRSIAFTRKPSKTLALQRPLNPFPFLPLPNETIDRCEEILSIQTHALMQRLCHTHVTTAIIGISGGLDSTLALLVTVRAFDALGWNRKNIWGVTMPCFGTTDRTYNNAIKLMNTLQVTLKEINIKSAVTQHLKDIRHNLSLHDVTYENAQARERTQVLMDLANQQKGLVIGTGDLSELALGWATYNGDQMSMYGINAGVPKTLVRCLVNHEMHCAKQRVLKDTLQDVLNTPVSPELLPSSDSKMAQKTEDLVGPYELHDFFLYYFIRFGFSPKKIYILGKIAFKDKYKSTEIKKWLVVFVRRFFAQQFKRSCLPDGPKVGAVGLSPRGDWRMPSDASVTQWLQELQKL